MKRCAMRKHVLLCFLFFTESALCKQKLSILFVVDAFPVLTETFIRNQVMRLAERGHSIKIHARTRGDSFATYHDAALYNWHEDSSYGVVYPYDLCAFDIIYCQFGVRALQILKQKKLSGSTAKLVTCFRGYDISLKLRETPNLYDQLLAEGDLFLPVCAYFAERLKQRGADPNKICVHYSAIEPNKFVCEVRPFAKNPNKRPVHLVSVARLVEKKGIAYAMRAVAQLVEHYPHLCYTIVGAGPLSEELHDLRNSLGLQDTIQFVGSLSHAEVITFLKGADILIAPSVTARNGDQEGIPNVLKEAMACGMPVVSTYHAGIPELVEHGVSGLLAPEYDSHVLARHIAYLIDNPEKWEAMGKAGRKKIEDDFDIALLIDRLENYFYSLLDR